MMERLSALLEALPSGLLLKLAVVSVIAFVGTLIAIPFILVRLPVDHFDVRVPRAWMKDQHPVLRIIGRGLKNIAGAVFVLAGFAMLVLPGQGLLTLLIGVSLLDFPGKQKLEARIVGHPKVLGTVNSLREKFGRPPFTIAPKD
ncbi:MAG TPA: PGPGW domain-containing protein [Terriglobia bacterium]|nr:PGPGW domain-containing protein [Terriglobia bacterium]